MRTLGFFEGDEMKRFSLVLIALVIAAGSAIGWEVVRHTDILTRDERVVLGAYAVYHEGGWDHSAPTLMIRRDKDGIQVFLNTGGPHITVRDNARVMYRIGEAGNLETGDRPVSVSGTAVFLSSSGMGFVDQLASLREDDVFAVAVDTAGGIRLLALFEMRGFSAKLREWRE